MNLHSIKAAAVAKKRSISAQATQSGQQVSTSVENVDNPVAKKEGVDTTQFAPDRPQEQQWMSQEELDSLKGDSFDFLKVSLSSVAVWVGLSIFTASILVYLFAPDENELLLSATPLTIVIGFILATLGFAFTYAELKPLPYSTTRSANTLRAAQATGIQTQILSDMTSYLYGGEEQHLEDALVAIFKVGKPKGLKKKRVPICVGISEEVFKTNDNRERYATVLHFTSKTGSPRSPRSKNISGPISRLKSARRTSTSFQRAYLKRTWTSYSFRRATRVKNRFQRRRKMI